jgi:hypothetical protein
MIGCPASPGSRKGSSEKKSWSVGKGSNTWLAEPITTVGFARQALVESGNGILNRTKLRFVYTELWRAVRGVNGLAMNGLAEPPDRH